MEAELSRARAILYGALAAGAAAAGPWMGWWTLLPVLVSLTTYRLLRGPIARAERPEWLIFGQVLFAQTLIAGVVVTTGGASSPVLVLSFLPLVTLPARFGPRGVHAGVLYSAVVLTIVAVAPDPAAAGADPSLLILVIVSLVGLAAFCDLFQRTEMRQRSRAALDALTGVLNRHTLEPRFHELREQAALTGAPIALVLCDVDDFKTINDRHGHAVGDAVLMDVARVLREHSRAFELIYRIGGDELLLLLPGRDEPEALRVAERLRADIECSHQDPRVTVSIGVASAAGGQADFQSLFTAADKALYSAKRAGRNRVASSKGVIGERGTPTRVPQLVAV